MPSISYGVGSGELGHGGRAFSKGSEEEDEEFDGLDVVA